MIHSLRGFAATICVIVGMGVTPLAAQETEPGDLAKIVEDIAASREATLARIQELSDGIDAAGLKLEEADKTFDEMIETLKAHAAIGAADGTYITRLEAFEQAALADAADAKVEGFLDFEEIFLEDAKVFSDQGEVLKREFEALDRRIRAVEAERTRVKFLIKAKRYDQIQKLFDDATGIIKEGTERVGEVEKALRERDPNLVEN
ncbi:hypothetical protein TRP8649_03620 [Pelagimonas phthalicica]|uniref:Uncharacterized protein n=1 Tax=Pelagimonas phthalicica TaxID=1037362 RepID=A0A238JGZ4_9RHOB|nr:hypothetical protein [Pelagimonas phthalicica]TDS92423.1 hypothetical protein CLV87_3618 [Pelagimonas phthalicica]SMX29484.1 hypothetical protein TRP8649_03620 [Pelagimonas phthalicica]